MDKIYECADNFIKLENKKYHFVFTQNRKTRDIILDFYATDFRHATGLHYISDIVIEQNPTKMIESILRKDKPGITDEKLQKSKKYKEVSPFSGSIEERISDMRFLEKCLDTSDYMRIYQIQPYGSQIDAEYYIESHCKEINSNVYIFIRKRKESDNYVIVSFFRKKHVFTGTNTYWMLKEKIDDTKIMQLYKNPKYNV